MSEYLEHLLRLDATGQHREIANYVAVVKHQPDVPNNIYMLLRQGRYFEAYTLARLVTASGVYNPVLSLAQAIGGFLFGNPSDAQFGLSSLATLVDRVAPEQQQFIGRDIVHPVIEHLMFSSDVQDPSVVLNILEVCKSGQVEIRRIFDWTHNDRALDPAAWLQQGRAKAKLISFASPPTGAPRRPLKTLVAMRERVFPKKPDSRLFDFGLLIASAMRSYGWQAQHFPMQFTVLAEDYRQIIEQCVRDDIDALFIDDHVISESAHQGTRSGMLQRLRQVKPDIKIIAIHLDPWAIDTATLVNASGMVDALWAPHPSMPVWQHPSLAPKMLFMPFPLAGQCPLPKTPLPPRLTFMGSILGYNWHRAFWAAGAKHGLEIETILSTHTDDGLPPLESHARYMEKLESTGCSVNFSMRNDLSRVLTARAFETVMAGALLIQEETTEIESYFVAGEHYLSFDTVRDLRTIAKFVREQPGQADAIRRRGNAFARERYSDEKIIGYLDHKLFP